MAGAGSVRSSAGTKMACVGVRGCSDDHSQYKENPKISSRMSDN